MNRVHSCTFAVEEILSEKQDKDVLGTPLRPHSENADTVFLVAARLRVALLFDRFPAIPRFPRI
jgi:hypothetical protein